MGVLFAHQVAEKAIKALHHFHRQDSDFPAGREINDALPDASGDRRHSERVIRGMHQDTVVNEREAIPQTVLDLRSRRG